MKLARVAFAAMLVSSQSFAQDARPGVAELKEVSGNVLVSREAGLGAVRNGTRLSAGMRVITTNKSRATVVYDDGCEVVLKENERFEVQTGKPCATLVSLPQSILLAPEGATVATAAGSAPIFTATIPIIGAAVALAILRNGRASQNVSPS